MFIPPLLAPAPHDAGAMRVVGVVRHERAAAFAVGAEILPRIEAEAGEVAHRPTATPFVLRPVRLSRVFDHHQPARSRDREYRIHVRGLPIQVHGHDRLRVRRDRPLDERRVHRVGDGIDVDEHRPRARVLDGRYRGDEGERHRDDLVAGPDARCQQRQVQRARAGVHRHRLSRAAEPGELALECRHFFAKNELRAVENTQHGLVYLGLDTAVLLLEVSVRNHARQIL